jgi:GNAT superfamily N-acetyltransferase
LRREIEDTKGTLPAKEERIFNKKVGDGELGERYFGERYKERFWVLEALVTDWRWQGRGLATRLVEWGMREVRERVEQGGKVEGVRLVADIEGLRTYEKAGFERVGNRNIFVEVR